jgi:hypothetical protein
MLKMASSGVLGSKKSSTYPRGYASGFFSPAALLDDHFEHPSIDHRPKNHQILKYFSMLI